MGIFQVSNRISQAGPEGDLPSSFQYPFIRFMVSDYIRVGQSMTEIEYI